jgi:hypothetical protein
MAWELKERAITPVSAKKAPELIKIVFMAVT